VKHLDSGVVAVGAPSVTFVAHGSDSLAAPPNGYHWEIAIGNFGGYPEEFDMTIEVQTPAGPMAIDAGHATVPPSGGLYWEYYINPDPFGEGSPPAPQPIAVRATFDHLPMGMSTLEFQTTITEDPMPAKPPCPGRVPPPPWWVPPGSSPGAGGSGSLPGVTFTLTLPESTPQPGDENGDGKVDAADYVAWLKMDGSPGGYSAWRTHFGETGGTGSALSAPSNAVAVPEPAGALLLLLAAVLCNSRRHRLRSST
jgi:hypothetical protein